MMNHPVLVRMVRSAIGSRINCLTARSISSQDIETQNLLDDIYGAVRAQRFRDIVVIQTKVESPKYLILANSFNKRHLANGTEKVNKQYKIAIKNPEDDFAQVSTSTDWNVIDLRSVVVHLFSEDCRKNYDIEQLWAVGDKYDELTNPEQTDGLSSALLGSRLTDVTS